MHFKLKSNYLRIDTTENATYESSYLTPISTKLRGQGQRQNSQRPAKLGNQRSKKVVPLFVIIASYATYLDLIYQDIKFNGSLQE